MKFIFVSILISIAVYFAIALGLVFSQSPQLAVDSEKPMDFSAAINADYSTLPEFETFEARDGSKLPFRSYNVEGESNTFVILIHGSGWHGMQFHNMAGHLTANGVANVIVPDLRGHGFSPERRGDVDHIGQFEEDIADLISHLKAKVSEDIRIVLAGHSSGGGLVVRFAGGEYGRLADGFVLMAPFLKYNAPTTKPNSGGWASTASRRIIGLVMLNQVGISVFNHLPVIAFNMPRSVLDGKFGETATTQYSFRLNTSYAPRPDFEADLAKMSQPFLLVAGANDEAFKSELYEEVISAQTSSGTYKILPDVGHIDLVYAPRAFEVFETWLAGFAAK